MPASVPNVSPLPASLWPVLMVGARPDVRQSVRRLDHLARPAMRDLHAEEGSRQAPFEAAITRDGVLLLAGLVILAAEYHHVGVRMRLDTQEVVRIARVPP